METYRLHIKIGPHEFQGEGPEEAVKRDFDEWRSLISLASNQKVLVPTPSGAQGTETSEIDRQLLARVIVADENRNLISVRMPARTDDRDGDTLLLILLGHKLLRNEDEVLVTQLKRELKQSGILADRIDRIATRPVNSGFLNKGGFGKGGIYSLTNAGFEYSKALLHSMATA